MAIAQHAEPGVVEPVRITQLLLRGRDTVISVAWTIRQIGSTLEKQPFRSAGKSELLYEDGEWRLRLVVADQDGSAAIREVHVTPIKRRMTPRGGISNRLLRGLPRVEDIVALAQARFRAHLGDDRQAVADLGGLAGGDVAVRPRGQSLSDVHLARVAVIYAQCVEKSLPPIPTLAQRLKYSESQIRDHVRKAREKGFLTAAAVGKASGEATDAARAAIAADHVRPGRSR